MQQTTIMLLLLLLTFQSAKSQMKWMYGVTRSGGTYGPGTIFRVDTNANNYTVVHAFYRNLGHPKYAQTLCKAQNGKYYGIATIDLGTHKYVIYEYDYSKNTYKAVKFFSNDIPNSSLVLHPNGFMYFTTKKTSGYGINGLLMRYDPQNNILQSILSFSGSLGKAPVGDLLVTSSGMIYGTTSQGGAHYCGTIYKYNPNGIISVVANFLQLTTGYQINGGLVEAANGKLYGICNLGGTYGKGTIVELDTLTGVLTKKLSLDTLTTGIVSKSKMALASNGKLYGVCSKGGGYNNGTLFSFDPVSGSFAKILDFSGTNTSLGSTPISNLFLASNGKLYGTCSQGGINNKGTFFEFNPLTNSFSKKKDFHSLVTGANPFGGFVENSGVLIGICEKGGLVSSVFANRGTIYSYSLNSNAITKNIVFEMSTEAAGAVGGLSMAPNGKFYGIGKNGGLYDYGMLYEFDPQTNNYQNLHEFDGTIGKWPAGKLLITTNSQIFGITTHGGLYNKGVIFKYDIASGLISKVVDFNGSNGSYPRECPIYGPSGLLYGITSSGGQNNHGIIYSLNPQTGLFTEIASLDSANTYSPYGGLFLASNGKMYATTQAPNYGGIFEFNPQSGSVSTKYVFGPNDGKWSLCKFVQGYGNKLYGTNSTGGVNNLGTLFEYNMDSNTFTLLTSFTGFVSSGSEPSGQPFISGNKLYGINSNGGSYSKGTLFEYDLQQHQFQVKMIFTNSTGSNPYCVQFLEYNCNNSFDTITTVACDFYVGKSSKIYTKSGTYYDTSYNACGALHIDLLNLNIVSNDTSVIKQGGLLHANQNNASYQWLYCDSAFKIIPGATSQDFYPLINGNYAVILSQANCSDTSSCHSFNNVGLKGSLSDGSILIYPNPSDHYLNIQFSKDGVRTARIKNIFGELLVQEESIDRSMQLNIQSFAPGIYLIEVLEGSKLLFIEKFIRR